MKNLIFGLTFLVSAHTYAEVILEFDQGQEVQCLKEAKALGCNEKSESKMNKCLEKQKKKLTKTCRDMHTAKNRT